MPVLLVAPAGAIVEFRSKLLPVQSIHFHMEGSLAQCNSVQGDRDGLGKQEVRQVRSGQAAMKLPY